MSGKLTPPDRLRSPQPPPGEAHETSTARPRARNETAPFATMLRPGRARAGSATSAPCTSSVSVSRSHARPTRDRRLAVEAQRPGPAGGRRRGPPGPPAGSPGAPPAAAARAAAAAPWRRRTRAGASAATRREAARHRSTPGVMCPSTTGCAAPVAVGTLPASPHSVWCAEEGERQRLLRLGRHAERGQRLAAARRRAALERRASACGCARRRRSRRPPPAGPAAGRSARSAPATAAAVSSTAVASTSSSRRARASAPRSRSCTA